MIMNCSRVMGQNLLHHILHYQLGFICMLGMAAALLHIIRPKTAAVSKLHFVALMVFAAWSGANGMPTIVLGSAPIAFALIVVWAVSASSSANTAACKKALVVLVVGTIAGYIAYQLTMSGIVEGAYLEDSGTYTLLSASEWAGNLGALPGAWFNSFMIVSHVGLDMLSLQGVVVVLSGCFALLAGFAPFVYLGYRKTFDEVDWLFEGCAIVVWGIVMLQFVCFRGPEPRMLYPAIMVNLLLLGAMIVRGRNTDRSIRLPYVGALFCAVSGIALYAAMLATANWTANVGVTQELAAHSLHYGFASFWNSNINTVNSGNDVKVRSILINENAISPFIFQSEGAWYDSTASNPDNSPWFLLLTTDEWEGMRQVSNSLSVESRSEHFQIGDEYHVLVFNAEQWGSCLSGTVNVVGE